MPIQAYFSQDLFDPFFRQIALGAKDSPVDRIVDFLLLLFLLL